MENFDESPVQSIYTYLVSRIMMKPIAGFAANDSMCIRLDTGIWRGVVGLCPFCGLDTVGLDIKSEDGAEMTDNQKYAVWPYLFLSYGHPLDLVESQEE